MVLVPSQKENRVIHRVKKKGRREGFSFHKHQNLCVESRRECLKGTTWNKKILGKKFSFGTKVCYTITNCTQMYSNFWGLQIQFKRGWIFSFLKRKIGCNKSESRQGYKHNCCLSPSIFCAIKKVSRIQKVMLLHTLEKRLECQIQICIWWILLYILPSIADDLCFAVSLLYPRSKS